MLEQTKQLFKDLASIAKSALSKTIKVLNSEQVDAIKVAEVKVILLTSTKGVLTPDEAEVIAKGIVEVVDSIGNNIAEKLEK